MKKYFLALCVMGIAMPAFAESVPTTMPATAAVAEAPKHWLSIDGSFDVTNEYIFRGYKAQGNGVIMQPSLTLSLNIPQLQSTDGLSITPYVGSWNSTSTVNTGPRSPKWFYETDLVVGSRFDYGNWDIDINYTCYSYPSGATASGNEVMGTISYDDSWLTKDKWHLPVAINPHFTIGQEINRSNNIAGGAAGTYLEFGIAPSIDVPVLGNTVTLSVPTTLGFSATNYYLDQNGSNSTFGYVSTGLKAELPLSFLSGKGFGDWKLVGSAIYTRMNADSTVQANGGKEDAIVGLLSLQFSY